MLARASDAATASAALPSNESLVDAASVALDDATASDSDGRRKRGASEMDGADEYDDDDDDDAGDYDVAGKDELKGDGKRGSAASKQQQQQRSRRHNWQPKYEMEFGLLAIERDAVSNDVTLAMCGFCKAFGREGKYEQLLQQDADAGGGADTKKRRRRSLTTTKFFRAFRVDNIRSHLQGAHPRRWSEYEMLPKQESIRSRYLQMHGDFQYDGLPIDDVVLNAESDIAYAQAQAQAIHANLSDAQGPGNGTLTTTSSSSATGHHFSTAMAYSGKLGISDVEELPYLRKRNNRLVAAGARSHFDYEKHLLEQLAIDRERLEFEKAKFKKEVELRERELAMKEKMMEQQRIFHNKQVELAAQASDQESGKLARLGETIREALVGTDNSSANDSVV